MKTVCIVQARMESTRLPGKVLLPIAGKPVIQHVLERCQRIRGVDEVICAMPSTPANRPLLETVQRLNVAHYLGHPTDCLNRYWHAAKAARADVIMRVTGDCPLIDRFWCADTLRFLGDHDYADNLRAVRKGLDCQVFTRLALDRAHREATDPYDREHVCPWMIRNLRCKSLGANYSIDTQEDYERVKREMEDD